MVHAQLDPGVALTGEDILEKVNDQIGERAAVPREVIVLDALPLTAVGKIFKPKLRWDAIRRVFEAELAAVRERALSLTVEVGEDKIFGTRATLALRPKEGHDRAEIEAQIKAVRASYSVHYTLEPFQGGGVGAHPLCSGDPQDGDGGLRAAPLVRPRTRRGPPPSR